MSNQQVSKQIFDERIIPDQTPKGIVSLHLVRYHFAAQFCRNKRVLDAACGVGYGSHFLSKTARSVTGIDLSKDAIEYARKTYLESNSEFRAMDICSMDFPDGHFDVICSFETIEHIPAAEAYLVEMKRVLQPEGIFIVSTPCPAVTTHKPENPFHYIEWSAGDFKALLGNHFSEVKLFAQKRKQTFLHRLLQKLDVLNLHAKFKPTAFTNGMSRAAGTTPFNDMDLEDLEIVENDFNRAMYTVAVCSNPKKEVN